MNENTDSGKTSESRTTIKMRSSEKKHTIELSSIVSRPHFMDYERKLVIERNNGWYQFDASTRLAMADNKLYEWKELHPNEFYQAIGDHLYREFPQELARYSANINRLLFGVVEDNVLTLKWPYPPRGRWRLVEPTKMSDLTLRAANMVAQSTSSKLDFAFIAHHVYYDYFTSTSRKKTLMLEGKKMCWDYGC